MRHYDAYELMEGEFITRKRAGIGRRDLKAGFHSFLQPVIGQTSALAPTLAIEHWPLVSQPRTGYSKRSLCSSNSLTIVQR
jgi:hypothetical protein